jgi:mRNA interferase HigB
MKVNVIRKQNVQDFAKLSNSNKSFNEWFNKVSKADWNSPNDIKLTFNSADLLGKSCNRVVFDIGGNNYRLICKYKFGKINLNKKTQVHLFVCWIGTHAEYTKLCNEKLQYTINLYKK